MKRFIVLLCALILIFSAAKGMGNVIVACRSRITVKHDHTWMGLWKILRRPHDLSVNVAAVAYKIKARIIRKNAFLQTVRIIEKIS